MTTKTQQPKQRHTSSYSSSLIKLKNLFENRNRRPNTIPKMSIGTPPPPKKNINQTKKNATKEKPSTKTKSESHNQQTKQTSGKTTKILRLQQTRTCSSSSSPSSSYMHDRVLEELDQSLKKSKLNAGTRKLPPSRLLSFPSTPPFLPSHP